MLWSIRIYYPFSCGPLSYRSGSDSRVILLSRKKPGLHINHLEIICDT